MRDRLTPRREPFAQTVDCPVDGLLPESFTALDSHAVVRALPRPARRTAVRARGAPQDPVPRDEAAAPGAPADARRQADDGARGRSAGAVPGSRRRRLRDAAAAVVQAARRRRQAHPEERRGAVPRSRHDLPPQAGLRRADGGMVPRGRFRPPEPRRVRALRADEGRLFRQRLFRRVAQSSRWPARAGTAFSCGPC